MAHFPKKMREMAYPSTQRTGMVSKVERKVEYEVFLCGCEACIPAPSISTPISEAQVLILSKLSFFLKVAIRYTTSLNSNGPTVNLS